MRGFTGRHATRFVFGVSTLALLASAAHAQDAATTAGQPGDSQAQSSSVPDGSAGEDVIITGIRASLRQAVDIKRDAAGVVDAISAEDIGKFPDTNLAESLQRITGVSIDRSNGEGSTVTVRGFGPEFNLVLLNGRQMPTSSLGDGASAPSTRSFDFANLASEGISAVEVYKTGRASVPSGGIGSTINIRTPRPLDRPGMRGSIAVKGVYDTSENDKTNVTPEVSGIFSDTFADGRFGILVSGIYQKRRASNNSYNTDWRDGYLGSENNWGSLPQPGTPGAGNIINRPDPTDVYEVPQNGSYNLNDINRERINGQLVLQFRPSDSITLTTDYTYSRNTVEVRNNSVGVWFNFGDTSSSWTDGPVAGPNFYSERFPLDTPNSPTSATGKDLSYSGALTANRSENKSLGGTLEWEAPGGMTVTLDAHHSTAESKPTNEYGTSVSIGNAVFGVAQQTINFEDEIPVISYQMGPGVNALNPALITPTGNAFRNAYFKDEINQVQLKARYDHEGGVLDSLDFGVSYVENKVRSAYGFLQNETWSGAGPASDIPDDIFVLETLPDKFKGLSGAGNIIPSFFRFDFERMAGLIDDLYGVCGGDGDCLADYTTDRRITEKVLSPYVQANLRFDVGTMPARVTGGLRYETTTVSSSALVPIPTSTRWVAENEFAIIFGGGSDFTRFKGSYDFWLPAIDADIEVTDGIKLRASYSHTITRAPYDALQGGRTIDPNFRIANGTGNQGNPGLLPFLSKNFDASAEWYYDDTSYISVGYFRKSVKNFISSERVNANAFGLVNPATGERFRAAQAALGPNAGLGAIRQYIADNYPNTVQIQPNGQIFILGAAGDDLLRFEITQPVNNDQTATLDGFEFAIQHSFWDTGFGAILNYTIVNGDVRYDNTLPASATQFALTGLSDSANAVLFYDKAGLQARVAYNWRDKFLSGTGPNPFYVEKYGQLDASASYEFLPGLTGFVEGINLLGESRRGHRRSEQNVFFASPGWARYSAGVRFTF